MAPKTPSRIVERVVATEYGSIRRLGPRGIGPRAREMDLALELELFECLDGRDDLVAATELRPGGTVRALVRITKGERVTAAGAPGRFKSRNDQVILKLSCPNYADLMIESCVEAALQPEGPQSVIIGWDILERKEAEQGLEVSFAIQAPPDCPRMSLCLELSCGTRGYAQRMCSLALELMGDRLVPALGELEPFYVDAAAVVPPNVGFLYVGKDSAHSLRVSGFHACQRLEAVAWLPEHGLCLARMSGAASEPKDVVARMHDFSRKGVKELQRWLAVLLAAHSDDLTVVIVDWSDAEIPWELVELAGSPPSYLGVRADVVRWTEVGAFHEHVSLSLSARVCSGGVAKFLHGATSPHLKHEEERLGLLRARPLETMDDVLECLDRQQDLALLYIACHGAFVGSQDEGPFYEMARLGAEARSPGAERRILELDIERVSLRKERSLVVLVNACQSGRMLQGAYGRTGLAERFLARVAQGYIGTLADVTNQHASEIGAEILRHMLASNGGCRPVRVLREIRRAYLAELFASRKTNDDWLRFLHAFYYVYYGQPLAMIQIHAAGTPEDVTRSGEAAHVA